MILPADPKARAVAERLHAQSAAQDAELFAYFGRRAKEGTLNWKGLDADAHSFMADKLVALEPEKAAFCAQICRGLRARTVVEIGTSYGVSTIHLADAVREVARVEGGAGKVIATEYEPAKAAAARAHWAEAGVADLIELREGDLRETLKDLRGPIDFVLMDIWTEMARPAIALIGPHLRQGAVVIADNTSQFAAAYADYFAYVNDPANRLRTQTLPFANGLEFTVRV